MLHRDACTRPYTRLYGLPDRRRPVCWRYLVYARWRLGQKTLEHSRHQVLITFVIEDAAFVGDTLFMPDYGTARTDFPGGDARTLFRSVQRLLALPDETRVFVCHDYQPDGREVLFESTVAAQKANNIHVATGISEDDFVAMREARDKTLAMPTLILPSLQVNMRAGHMPPLDGDQRLFLKVPINVFGGAELSTLGSAD